jgi:hypothetical protein
VPSRTPFAVGVFSAGVLEQAGVELVADASFEGSQGFFAGLALGAFAVEVGPTFSVGEAELGHGDDVDGVVEPPVASAAQPVDLLGSR